MIKKIANRVVWGLAFLLTMGIVVWANIEQSNTPCETIEVLLKETDHASLTSKEMIKSDIIESMPALLGQSTKNIALEELEHLLTKNTHLCHNKTYINLNGNVCIKTTPRKAILRIFDEKGVNSYLGNKKVLMKNSPSHSQRIIVASGHIKHLNKTDILSHQQELPRIYNDLYNLANYINNDDFLSALIDQIYVKKNQELELTPKIGVKQIYFGTIDNMEEKLENLKSLYINGEDKIDWQKYHSINIKYKNQIVCSKK